MHVSPQKIYTSVYTGVAEFISYYAVPDSRKYTFPFTVKGLCVLGYDDSQYFVPLHNVCIAVGIQHFYKILLYKQDICAITSKTPYQYDSCCYVHFTVPQYVRYYCLNNTSQSYVYITYVSSITQYPLEIHTP